MKAMVLTGIREIEMMEWPDPVLANEKDVLIKLESVGVCGSDIHWFAEGTTGAGGFKEPFVLGHEFAAVVESGAKAITSGRGSGSRAD